MREDAAHALGALLRRPTFAALAVLTLAVGIGSAVAVFSVVHTVLLQPLPFAQPDELVVIEPRRVRAPETVTEAVYMDVMAWRALESFEDVAAYASSSGRVLSIDGEADRIGGKLVTWNFFAVLGVPPVLGRGFTAEDGRPGAAQVALIHEALWRDAFGADPEVVGRTVVLDGERTTIVGVLPAAADVPVGDRIWSPVGSKVPVEVLESDGTAFLNPIGRLVAGVSPEAAAAELDAYFDRVTNQRGYGEANETFAAVRPLGAAVTGDVRRPLLLLFGATVLLLMIACANVASLQLVRALDGARDAAVRIALGAGTWRVVRRALVESALLASVGAALGVVLAALGIGRAVRAAPVLLFRGSEVSMSMPVLAFAIAVAFGVAVAAGVAPAAFLARRSVRSLVGAPASTRSRGSSRALSGLVGTQVALAVALLVGAGLLGRSFAALHAIDTGFDRAGTLTLRVPLHGDAYDDEGTDRFFETVAARVGELPGVEAAGGILIRPLETAYGYDYTFTVEGRPVEEQPSYPYANYQAVTPGYFPAMGIELLAGRDVAFADDGNAPPVVVVGESMARRFWGPAPGEAVGKRLKFGPPEGEFPWITVVGVVEDVRQRGMLEGRLDLYVPFRQSPWQLGFLAVRTSAPTASVLPAVREAIASVDAGVQVVDVAPMSRLVAMALARPRFLSVLVGAFSAAALLLGAMGLYGVLAYAALLRSREMGLRMALGATRSNVRALIVGWGVRLAAVGAAVGFGVAYISGGLAEGQLYGVTPLDGTTYLGVALVLLFVAVAASWLPAVRATRVDPSVVLRD